MYLLDIYCSQISFNSQTMIHVKVLNCPLSFAEIIKYKEALFGYQISSEKTSKADVHIYFSTH